jgi:hypothetical protein
VVLLALLRRKVLTAVLTPPFPAIHWNLLLLTHIFVVMIVESRDISKPVMAMIADHRARWGTGRRWGHDLVVPDYLLLTSNGMLMLC